MQTLFDKVAEPKPRQRTPSEIAKAREVLDSFEHLRASWLDAIRAGVKQTWIERYKVVGCDASVTADDARQIFEAIPDVPGSQRLSRNFLGQVFRGDGWQWTGKYVKSHTKDSHGNTIKCWQWVGG